jgi:alpha-tubulin suppressor-like RCC1 family protein
VPVPGISTAESIASGFIESCAILPGGIVSCWGLDDYGQVGVSTAQASTCLGYPCVTSPRALPSLSGVIQLALTISSACALRADGTVWCWGSNLVGALGRDAANAGFGPEPGQVLGIDDARAIAAGGGHVCAIRPDKTVWCWGLAAQGQTGQPLYTTQPCPEPYASCTLRPAQVAGLSNVRALALGYGHSCALTESDAVFCWGENGSGQLGHDPTLDDVTDAGAPYTHVPRLVDLPAVDSIACGKTHTCALLKNGEVGCFGRNYAAQLGVDPRDGSADGATVPWSFVPLTVTGLE